MKLTVSVFAVTLLSPFVAAAADEGKEPIVQTTGEVAEPRPPAQVTSNAGSFLPFSLAAAIDGQRAYAMGLGGYDTARTSGSFEAAAEVRVWGPFALRAGAVYVNNADTLRPSVGARAQFLHAARQGVDGAIGVFYKPEGLTEPEGEIETVLSIGRQAGPVYLLGNLAYGQDPEGNERDGEVRAAALRPVGSRATVGIDGRFRFDLGSQEAKLLLHHEAKLDVLVGPSVAVFVGPVALLAHAGGSAVRFAGSSLAYGVFGLAGVGTVF